MIPCIFCYKPTSPEAVVPEKITLITFFESIESYVASKKTKVGKNAKTLWLPYKKMIHAGIRICDGCLKLLKCICELSQQNKLNRLLLQAKLLSLRGILLSSVITSSEIKQFKLSINQGEIVGVTIQEIVEFRENLGKMWPKIIQIQNFKQRQPVMKTPPVGQPVSTSPFQHRNETGIGTGPQASSLPFAGNSNHKFSNAVGDTPETNSNQTAPPSTNFLQSLLQIETMQEKIEFINKKGLILNNPPQAHPPQTPPQIHYRPNTQPSTTIHHRPPLSKTRTVANPESRCGEHAAGLKILNIPSQNIKTHELIPTPNEQHLPEFHPQQYCAPSSSSEATNINESGEITETEARTQDLPEACEFLDKSRAKFFNVEPRNQPEDNYFPIGVDLSEPKSPSKVVHARQKYHPYHTIGTDEVDKIRQLLRKEKSQFPPSSNVPGPGLQPPSIQEPFGEQFQCKYCKLCFPTKGEHRAHVKLCPERKRKTKERTSNNSANPILPLPPIFTALPFPDWRTPQIAVSNSEPKLLQHQTERVSPNLQRALPGSNIKKWHDKTVRELLSEKRLLSGVDQYKSKTTVQGSNQKKVKSVRPTVSVQSIIERFKENKSNTALGKGGPQEKPSTSKPSEQHIICDICPVSFPNKPSLDRHKELCHNHKGKKN